MRDIIRLGQVDPVRKRIADATHALLGETIVLSDEQWRAASLVPGWSRAHVATHLARSADAMARATLLAGVDRGAGLYPSDAARVTALERGAERSGIEIQIDLDTTAGHLAEVFAGVTDWFVPVQLPIGEFPLSAMVVARLHEVSLHHIDLNVGGAGSEVEPVQASWLLQFAALWVRTKTGMPAVHIESDSGVVESVGDVGEPRTVTGSDMDLWLWLAGRGGTETLTGADGLTWPLLG